MTCYTVIQDMDETQERRDYFCTNESFIRIWGESRRIRQLDFIHISENPKAEMLYFLSISDINFLKIIKGD